MKILAIETSCDETAIALLEVTGPLEKPEVKVVANEMFSQAKLHEPYGGVYPNLAKREHEKNLPILLEKIGKPEIDYIAVTTGPGLEPALWTGITFAEKLGKEWNKPVVPVNHMEGHIYSVLYGTESNLTMPALALLISGGHTELVHVKDFGDYEILGRTKDDAVGEAFDKGARMLGLPYPGGPEISKLAKEARNRNLKPDFKFPRPMIHSKDLNFSFSGLKTAVLYKIKDLTQPSPSHGEGRAMDNELREKIAREFEDAVAEVLIEKTRKAIEMLDIKTLIVAGGVSANKYLRERFQGLNDCLVLFPTPLLSTDNAIMIGLASHVRTKRDPTILSNQELLKADGNLSLNN